MYLTDKQKRVIVLEYRKALKSMHAFWRCHERIQDALGPGLLMDGFTDVVEDIVAGQNSAKDVDKLTDEALIADIMSMFVPEDMEEEDCDDA